MSSAATLPDVPDWLASFFGDEDRLPEVHLQKKQAAYTPRSPAPSKNFAVRKWGGPGAEALANEHAICDLASRVSTAGEVGKLLKQVRKLPAALQVEPLISTFYSIGKLQLHGEDVRVARAAWLYVAEQRLRSQESFADFVQRSGAATVKTLGPFGLIGNFALASVVGSLNPGPDYRLWSNPRPVLEQRAAKLNDLMRHIGGSPPQ